MSLVRPVTSTGHGKQGVVSQTFGGQFSWEPRGWMRRGAVARIGKRVEFANATEYTHIHLAIDYICVIGTKAYAVASGTVTDQGKDSTGAWYVYLRIRRGAEYDVYALYLHVSAFKRREGDRVRKGDVVALTGATGKYVTGPHLHFELIRVKRGETAIYSKGLRYDPQPFISGTARLTDIAP